MIRIVFHELPARPVPLGADEVHVWPAARAALDELLRNYTGAASIHIERSKRGKPFLATGDLRFNLSHSGALTLLAFTRGREVGIDVECEERKIDHVKLAERFFAPAEAAVVRDGGRAAFFRIWTRKEAYVKALGLGIAGLGLGSFSVFPEKPRLAGERLGECLLWDLAVQPGYRAAVAVTAGACPASATSHGHRSAL